MFFVDSGAHVILEFNEWKQTDYTASVFAGTIGATGSVDGTGLSVLLNSPHGIASFGNSLFFCDSGNYAIRLITSGKPLQELANVFHRYAEVFSLHHNEGDAETSPTFEEGLKVVDNVVEFLLSWEESNYERTGRRATQGPDQILPHITRRSFS